MKKILLVASLLALLATGCKNKQASTDQSGTEAGKTVTTAATGAIAYVNLDSLISKFDMYIDLRSDYETKAKKADADLTSKGRSLESAVRDYQDKVQKGLVTSIQARNIEEDLNRRQQAFMQQREQVMGELTEEEQVMLNNIHYSITDFLKEFNSDYKYDMILSTTGGGPILSANPSLDITTTVLEGLNKKYAATKATKK